MQSQMSLTRYKELSVNLLLKLTEQEYADGWRFCECEWDGMLININDTEGEGQFCDCYAHERED